MPEKNEHKEIKHKHGKDSVAVITGGLILIWLGVLFLLRNMGFIWWHNWWAYLLLGIGVILIIDAIIRSAVPQYRCGVAGRIIAGIVLILIGGINIYGIGNLWPLILVAVGIAIIIGAVWKHKSYEESS